MATSTMSAQTTNQLKNGEQIKITAETFPADAREEAAKRLADGGSLDESRATVAASIASIARASGGANASLEAAENAYTAEQADDPPVRKQRDDATTELAQRWTDVKSQVARRFGAAAVREYGLEGELPATPDALSKQAANAAKLLRAKPRTHASPLGEFTTEAAAAYLEEAQTPLAAALTAVTTEAKELQDALGRRDAATADWRDIYQASATLLEGYLRLGKRLDLADRVRPTARRAAGLEVTPPAPAEPVPTPTPSEPPPTT